MPKCYSIRLQGLIRISEKCYRAIAFDGSEALIPKSQVFGPDYGVQKSEAYWITEWILDRVDIQHSRKKWTTFTKSGENIGQITIEHHIPEVLDPTTIKHNEALKRPKRK